ncbi:MAG: hypothetical protein HY850_09340 [Betaproteobacteria bacterium]|nr:hypothetical protein [Betaproteobacteria bacterium]
MSWKKYEPRAIAAKYDADRKPLVIELSTGAELSVTPNLLGLSPDADLNDVEITGGGFDLYFSKIDEGAFVPDLCRSAFDMRAAA